MQGDPAYPPQQAPASGTTVVVTQPGVVGSGGVHVTEPYPSNVGAIIFSCVVAWCCCCCFGLAAFILASKSK